MKAFKEKDIEAIMKFWYKGPDIVLMGTGAGELYVGKGQIKNAHFEFFKTIDSEYAKITFLKIASNGNVAWIMATAQVTVQLKMRIKGRN